MAIMNYIDRHLITYDVIKHSHNYWEVIYTTQGGGIIKTAEGLEINYETNQAIVIPPHIEHINHSSCGFHNIHMTINNWQPKIPKTSLVTDNSNQELLMAMKQAHHYFHTEVPNKSNVLFALTELIVSYIEMFLANPVSSSITQIIESEIINNYTNPSFKIEYVLDKIPYSKEYIRKMFIKERGISPLQYLINKRIISATKLLSIRKNHEHNIREISEKSGFTDQLYFSRVFKKIIGVTPKDYRQDMLEDFKVLTEDETE